MNYFVKDKVVVVTGAGSGIGKDIALALAANGARVVVNDLGKDGDGVPMAQKVADQIRVANGVAEAVVADVSVRQDADAVVGKAVEVFGRIDAVVNNAGIVRDRFFFKMEQTEWESVIAVHLHGTFNISRAAAPVFKSQQCGSLVHMTSSSGLFGNYGQANYAAAKMGIVGLSKIIALDMKKFNVRSNCISPWAWTAMTATIPADSEANIRRIQKLKKMESHKIAPLAIYLVSDASIDVTGQIFGVRANEIYLFSQPRILRSMHREGGWTPEAIAEHVMPAMAPDFTELRTSMEVIPWDPV